MSRNRTRIAAALLAVPLLLALTGCIKLETIVNIQSDDAISMQMGIGMEKEYADQLQMTVDQLCKDVKENADDYQDTSDSKYVSCRVTKNTNLAALSSSDSGFSITREGDVYKFAFDTTKLKSEATEGGGTAELDLSEIYSNINISVTFPGPVLSASGNAQILGNTVSWTDPKDLLGEDGITATGQASGSGNPAPPDGEVLGSISLTALAQLAVDSLMTTPQMAGQPTPTIDCGTGSQIDVVIGKVVNCTLTDGANGDFYDVAVTMANVIGDQLFVDVKVAAEPKDPNVPTPTPTPTPTEPLGGFIGSPLFIGLIVGVVVIAAVVVVLLLVRGSSKKKAATQASRQYSGYPQQGQYHQPQPGQPSYQPQPGQPQYQPSSQQYQPPANPQPNPQQYPAQQQPGSPPGYLPEQTLAYPTQAYPQQQSGAVNAQQEQQYPQQPAPPQPNQGYQPPG